MVHEAAASIVIRIETPTPMTIDDRHDAIGKIGTIADRSISWDIIDVDLNRAMTDQDVMMIDDRARATIAVIEMPAQAAEAKDADVTTDSPAAMTDLIIVDTNSPALGTTTVHLVADAMEIILVDTATTGSITVDMKGSLITDGIIIVVTTGDAMSSPAVHVVTSADIMVTSPITAITDTMVTSTSHTGTVIMATMDTSLTTDGITNSPVVIPGDMDTALADITSVALQEMAGADTILLAEPKVAPAVGSNRDIQVARLPLV